METTLCTLCGSGAPHTSSHLILFPNVWHPSYHTDFTDEEHASERLNHLAEVIYLLEVGFEGGFT